MSKKQFLVLYFYRNLSSALLLPYLEVSVNQDYLVKRIGELASGSCLGIICWDWACYICELCFRNLLLFIASKLIWWPGIQKILSLYYCYFH